MQKATVQSCNLSCDKWGDDIPFAGSFAERKGLWGNCPRVNFNSVHTHPIYRWHEIPPNDAQYLPIVSLCIRRAD